MFRLTFAFLVLSAVSAASAVTLDIDSLPHGMDNVPGSAVPAANRVSNGFLPQGVLITSTAAYAAVVFDGGGGTAWKANDPAVIEGLGGVNVNGSLDYHAPITFTFVNPANASTAYVTNAFSLYGDYYGDGSTFSLTGYDVLGNQVAQASVTEHSGIAAFGDKLALSAANIHSVVFQGSGTVAISNIQFNAPTPVPEPAALAALGLGVAATLRRRRRAA